MSTEPTTEEQSKALFRRAMDDVFAAQDVDAIDSFYAEDLIQHSEAVSPGADGLKEFFGGLYQGFPDLEPSIDHLYAEDDHVFALLTWQGTHTGEFMGVDATGKAVRMRTAELLRVEDGTFAEHWDVVDQLGMLSTLGLVTIHDPQLE